MKNLLTILSFLLVSTSTFSQTIQKLCDFSDGPIVYEMEPVLMDSLFNVYNIDTTGYRLIPYFGEFDLNLDLHENYQCNIVVYELDKLTSEVTCFNRTRNGDKVKLNKYMLLYIMDSDKSKIINIIQF